MKVWKSPVFYLGVILLAAVIAALAAPFVVDWNAYRADLEAYGEKLTGRDVTIAGPISVRLFPWPSLTANDLHISNPPGLEEPEFASASRMTVRMQLAGLLSGTIQVESIEIDNPVIAVERMATGQGNWLFTPAADAAGLAGAEMLGRVKLDQITLRDTRLRLIDRRRGSGEAVLEIPAATLSSPGLAGPWRLLAPAVNQGGRSFAVTVNTAIWRAGEPLRLSINVKGADASGPSYNFDGAVDGDRIAGDVQVETAAKGGGKSDAEGELRPLVLRSRLVATFDAMAFDEIEIAPLDPAEGGTLMSGSAKLALGQQISAAVDLSAPTLDLGAWAGARANELLRSGGGLAVADSLLAMLPDSVDVAGTVKVTALTMAGEMLENAELSVEANREAIRVRRLSASLPGRSQVLFEGIFFPGKAGAELAGNLALESNDLRQLASWAWPAGRDGISGIWTGSRGRLKLQTNLSLTQDRFRLTGTQYEIDAVPGSAELSVSLGGRGAVDLRIDAGKIDVDNFIPGGVSAMPGSGNDGLSRLFALLAPRKDARDLRLTLQTGQLLLNGVTADEVTVDLASGSAGLDLRTVEIGSVGGARLLAAGLILDTGSGLDGSVNLSVNAAEPRGLLRLFGLVPADATPAWAATLGETMLKGALTVKPAGQGTAAGFNIIGQSGDFDIQASGKVVPGDSLAALRIDGTADLRATSSASFARLAGLSPAAVDRSPARFTITGSGSLAAGILTTAQLQAYGGLVDFSGSAAGPEVLKGKLALRATDMAPLLQAMGLPLAAPPVGVLVLDSNVSSGDGGLRFDDLSGRFGVAPISGKLAWLPGGRVSGDLDIGELDLRALLAGVLLGWNGQPPGLDTPLAAALPMGLTGEVWLTPARLHVHENFTAADAQIAITADAGGIRIVTAAKDAAGRDARIEIGSQAGNGTRKVDGKLTLPVDLASQLRLAGGGAVAEGQGRIDLAFTAEGRSPGGVLSALAGSGSYDIDGLTLLNLSPAAFTKALAEAGDAAGLAAAFEALRGGGGLAIGDVSGLLTVQNGIAAFLPFSISGPDADAMVKTTAELASGEIDIGVTLSLKAREGLPAMEVSYAGPPAALARNEDKAELASKLGYTIMQQGVAELERLQKEQQRLALEEEKLRLQDEERLAAYYAQRDEVLLRKRELKVHAEMRVLAAEKLRREIESERAANAEINKGELKQRLRELRVHRRMAKLEKQPEAKPADTAAVEEQPVMPKPAPRRPRPRTEQKPPAAAPVILVPPVASPSQ